jgi:hypothetical protein
MKLSAVCFKYLVEGQDFERQILKIVLQEKWIEFYSSLIHNFFVISNEDVSLKYKQIVRPDGFKSNL